jgi:ATP phosphoribosyltransferase regulatory subunit HisZ
MNTPQVVGEQMEETSQNRSFMNCAKSSERLGLRPTTTPLGRFIAYQ